MITRFLLLVVLAVSCARGATMAPQPHSYSANGAASTLTFQINGAGSLTYAYTRGVASPGTPPAGSGTYDGGVRVYLVASTGSTTAVATVFNYASSGASTSGSGTYGSVIAAGQWVYWAIFVLDGATLMSYQNGWVQYGTDTVTLAGTNTKPYAIRITTTATGTSSPILTTTDVNAGAAYSISVPLPTGVTGIDVKYWMPATFTHDGGWVETSAPSTGTGVTTLTNVPSGTTTSVPPPSNAPLTGPPSTTGGGAIWDSTNVGNTTTTGTALDKQTFREGVGQIIGAVLGAGAGGGGTDMTATNGKLDVLHADNVSAQDGSAWSSSTFSSAAYDTTTFAPINGADPTGLNAKLPTSPMATVLPTSISPTSHFTFSIATPTWLGRTGSTYAVDADLSPWASQIAVLRALMLAGLSIGFFFLTVQTLKKALV